MSRLRPYARSRRPSEHRRPDRRRAPRITEWRVDDDVASAVDTRTLELARQRHDEIVKRRGWLLRRALVAADLLGLVTAFAIAEWLFGVSLTPWDDRVPVGMEIVVFLATLPAWIVVAKLYGLYRQDEERTDHSTADDFIPVFHVVTVGTWLFVAGSWATGLAQPKIAKLLVFWALAVTLVTASRAVARRLSRLRSSYIQNTVVVGAGEVGRLIARKLIQHPEYGLNLVGFVDARDPERGVSDGRTPVLGPPNRLPELIPALDIERVILAFPDQSDEELLGLVHQLRTLRVQVDIVPRLFEAVGPAVDIHSVEGLPLIGLPPSRLSGPGMLAKRAIDIAVASVIVTLTAPLFAYIAIRIKLDTPGPVFFRQRRLGMNMQEFTMLKFRTMRVGADQERHRAYIEKLMDRGAEPDANGLFKLERPHEITPFGRWLRRTSLDELPQLLNVLRGEMSLVGPRPCLPYETEHFKPHHFERFLVPAGLTGLWQVTARARSTFLEALEMDVAYARGWSLGLDLWLLARTPMQLLSSNGTA